MFISLVSFTGTWPQVVIVSALGANGYILRMILTLVHVRIHSRDVLAVGAGSPFFFQGSLTRCRVLLGTAREKRATL